MWPPPIVVCWRHRNRKSVPHYDASEKFAERCKNLTGRRWRASNVSDRIEKPAMNSNGFNNLVTRYGRPMSVATDRLWLGRAHLDTFLGAATAMHGADCDRDRTIRSDLLCAGAAPIEARSGARTIELPRWLLALLASAHIELPRWPLALLASAARADEPGSARVSSARLRASPTRNAQHWAFVVVRDAELRRGLARSSFKLPRRNACRVVVSAPAIRRSLRLPQVRRRARASAPRVSCWRVAPRR
jgi:hypothetical protein